MIAGQKFEAPVMPWPVPSAKMIEKWTQRHQAFKTFSAAYMSAQRRMLVVAQLPPEDRFEEFEKICFQRCIAPTTAETYWTTLLSIQRSLCLDVSEADTRITRIIKARSVAFPTNFPTPASLSDVESLVKVFNNEFPSLVAVMTLTFILGQRISDMVQLSVTDLEVQEKFLLITVRRGKTFTTAKPYTLWLRRHTFPTEELIEVAARSRKANRMFLLTETNSEAERAKVLNVIKDLLFSVNDNLELRSIRRGGLHLMAQNGHPLTTILNFSRHADQDMLMRYLDWGKVSTDHREEMLAVVDDSMCALVRTIPNAKTV